jgi:hypothetical protein
MVKGNFGLRPMTETMEIIHGIRNITPGAIAITATLVSVLLSLGIGRLLIILGNLVSFRGRFPSKTRGNDRH